MWTNHKQLNKLFAIEGHSFWPSIKNTLLQTYKNRMEDYITFIISTKKLLKMINFSCIISINVIGETEKIILGTNKNRIPSIMLEHGFTTYLPEISRFDMLSMYPIFRDKIAVWGNIQKKYLLEYRKIPEDRILVPGSPRHDIFFKRKKSKTLGKTKKILIMPQNMGEANAQIDTNSFIRLEKLLKRIINIAKKLPDVDLIIKLHPSQEFGSEYLKKLIQKIAPNIRTFQTEPILDVIQSCDVILNINTELFVSTVLFEGLILEKPILNIVTIKQPYEYEYERDKAVLSISDKSDLEKYLNDIIYNNELQHELVENGKKFVRKYLTNPSTASQSLAKILNSY